MAADLQGSIAVLENTLWDVCNLEGKRLHTQDAAGSQQLGIHIGSKRSDLAGEYKKVIIDAFDMQGEPPNCTASLGRKQNSVG